jgi:hypothetical protein
MAGCSATMSCAPTNADSRQSSCSPEICSLASEHALLARARSATGPRGDRAGSPRTRASCASGAGARAADLDGRCDYNINKRHLILWPCSQGQLAENHRRAFTHRHRREVRPVTEGHARPSSSESHRERARRCAGRRAHRAAPTVLELGLGAAQRASVCIARWVRHCAGPERAGPRTVLETAVTSAVRQVAG